MFLLLSVEVGVPLDFEALDEKDHIWLVESVNRPEVLENYKPGFKESSSLQLVDMELVDVPELTEVPRQQIFAEVQRDIVQEHPGLANAIDMA